MKMTVQHLHVRSTHRVDALVEESILALDHKVRIDEARVRLECRWHESPGFRAAIHLVTPGPDLKAEGWDHTLEAAIAKAIAHLEEKLSERAGNRRQRKTSRLQMPVSTRLRINRN